MKRIFFLCVSVVIAAMTFTACNDDDEVQPELFDQVLCDRNGDFAAHVNYGGTIMHSDTTRLQARIVVQRTGEALIRIAPMQVKIKMPVGYGNEMTIATTEPLTIDNGLYVTQKDGETELKGSFEQMISTSLKGGEPMPMLIKGRVEAEVDDDEMEIELDVEKWGNMPFPLELEFRSPELEVER